MLTYQNFIIYIIMSVKISATKRVNNIQEAVKLTLNGPEKV